MRILITGVTGFAGSFLAEELLNQTKEHTIFGTNRENVPSYFRPIVDKVKLFSGDLEQLHFIEDVIKSVKPDVIFHLAAKANTAQSFHSASETILSNLKIQLQLFDSVLKYNLNSKIIIASSAEVYGIVAEKDNPISETLPVNPGTPYGMSKTAQDLAAYTYFKSNQLQTIRLRLFNHTGPRQRESFVIPSFAKQIVAIEKDHTKERKIFVGNLNAVRDFCDVRDIAKAYVAAMEKGEIGAVYNVGSGKGYKLKELLQELLHFAQIPIEIMVDQNRLRKVDLPVTICNNHKFCFQTKWAPCIPISQTLEDIINYWRNIL